MLVAAHGEFEGRVYWGTSSNSNPSPSIPSPKSTLHPTSIPASEIPLHPPYIAAVVILLLSTNIHLALSRLVMAAVSSIAGRWRCIAMLDRKCGLNDRWRENSRYRWVLLSLHGAAAVATPLVDSTRPNGHRAPKRYGITTLPLLLISVSVHIPRVSLVTQTTPGIICLSRRNSGGGQWLLCS